MRKIYATVTLNIVVRADEGADVEAAIEQAANKMLVNDDECDVEHVEVTNIEVTDSK